MYGYVYILKYLLIMYLTFICNIKVVNYICIFIIINDILIIIIIILNIVVRSMCSLLVGSCNSNLKYTNLFI